MKMVEKLGLIALRRLDPERAHGVALKALQMGLAPTATPHGMTSSRLQCQIAGLQLDNPLGLAAGFDKNAQAIKPLSRAGFGFLEVGAATPQAQSGNARPRLFRLTEDRAVINRFGFNNDGMVTIAKRMEHRPKGAVVGLNLGANKDSADRAEDFAKVLAHCGHALDFATVNVSSPNTESLRDLQGKAALSALLAGVLDTNSALPHPIPIFVKIAPDLDRHELDDVAEVALSSGIDGIIATNTTLNREGLHNRHRSEKGDFSTGEAEGAEILLTLGAWSALSRRDAEGLVAEIRRVTEGLPEVFEGFRLVNFRHRRTVSRREVKAGLFVAEASFRAVVE